MITIRIEIETPERLIQVKRHVSDKIGVRAHEILEMNLDEAVRQIKAAWEKE